MFTGIIERAVAAVPTAEDIGGLVGTVDTEVEPTVDGLVTLVIGWILYIAAILAFIYLVVSGITFITAGGNAEQAKKGQTGLIFAVIGIVVVVLAYVILQAAADIGTAAPIS